MTKPPSCNLPGIGFWAPENLGLLIFGGPEDTKDTKVRVNQNSFRQRDVSVQICRSRDPGKYRQERFASDKMLKANKTNPTRGTGLLASKG